MDAKCEEGIDIDLLAGVVGEALIALRAFVSERVWTDVFQAEPTGRLS